LVAEVTPPALPQTVIRSQRPSSELLGAVDLLEGGSNKFTKLSAALYTKLHKIENITTLATVRDYLNYKQNSPPSADDCADASERDAVPV
jgi:hypothetical protein